jgi:nitrate/nitrite transporter NarK
MLRVAPERGPDLQEDRIVSYLAHLSAGRFVLWCYFIWWGVVLVRYFDGNARLWLTSLGLSVIIGAALLINATASGKSRVRLEAWPTFRFFLIPFCVSSFAALAKGRGFILIFSPRWEESAVAVGACGALGGIVAIAKRLTVRPAPTGSEGTT